ncbi:hypothetical protein ACOSQ2_004466 [Xanthoceras sorbifolium]
MGANGMVIATKAIGRKIYELDGRIVTVASSPKFRVYETEFGWAKPKKVEMVHITAYIGFSLCENREEDGGLDIGVVVGRDRLDLFNAIFEQTLQKHKLKFWSSPTW